MSVSSSTSRIVYAGNNSLVTAYAVPFYFEENAHLNAIAKTAAGVETVVTLTNHTGAGNENGGTVRTAVAVPATSTLTIYREVPFTQATSYEENDAFPAASHERALDKLTTITQQLERRITNCIRGTEATPLSPIPSPTGTQQFVLSAASNQPPSWQELPVLATGPVVATGSTQARFISDRFADVVNVKDFGAVGDGVADDTAAFASAIAFAPGTDALDNSWNVAFPLCVTIYVPAGNYRLNNVVETSGRDVTYILSHGASFSPTTPLPYTGTLRLNGRVVRDGLHFSAYHFGIKDKAGTLSIQGNPLEGHDEGAFINGFSNPFQLADIFDRDSSTLVVANRNIAPYAKISNADYTSTTINPAVPLTADEVKLLKVGMTIDTFHATKYSGFITSWASNGASITVSGWFQQGNQSAGQIPPNGFGAMVQNFTKIFTQNNVLWFDRGVDKAYRASGFELSIHNNRSSVGATDATNNANTDYVWGFDSTINGRYGATVAYLARGPYQNGFHALPQAASKTTGQSYSRAAALVTVTSISHGLANGDIVKITSSADVGLEGYQTITVPSADTFTFTTSSVGVATGVLNWEFRDYSLRGFFYGGNGVGLRFDNLSANQGRAIEVNNFGSAAPAFILYGDGLAESKNGFNISKTSGDSIFFSETGSGNSICRLKTAANNWSLISWNAGHFSLFEQSTLTEKLKVDAAPATDPVWIYVNGTLKKVTEGAANSGGTGFKLLRVVN